MVNSIINAITKQLGSTFGTNYRYYVEDIEQSFIPPCFHVGVRIPIQRSTSPVLYERTMPVVIHFFSDNDSKKIADSYSMGERIVECLEYLPFKNTTLRGENISYQMVDGVLQVFITYSFITKRDEQVEDSMATVSESVTHTQ